MRRPDLVGYDFSPRQLSQGMEFGDSVSTPEAPIEFPVGTMDVPPAWMYTPPSAPAAEPLPKDLTTTPSAWGALWSGLPKLISSGAELAAVVQGQPVVRDAQGRVLIGAAARAPAAPAPGFRLGGGLPGSTSMWLFGAAIIGVAVIAFSQRGGPRRRR